jgi:hypothetical protein
MPSASLTARMTALPILPHAPVTAHLIITPPGSLMVPARIKLLP